MTDTDLHNMIQKMVNLTVAEMSKADMADFVGDRLENDFYRRSMHSVVEHFKICWPEQFEKFEFEQKTKTL
jgi:hypothetical protein